MSGDSGCLFGNGDSDSLGIEEVVVLPNTFFYSSAVIVHEPFQPHAMRTESEPLLTLWAWQDDISFESYRFEPDGVDANGVPI